MKHVILLTGISRSGGTILSQLFSKHPDVTSLGELWSFIHGKKKTGQGTEKYCGCGKKYSDCDFWGSIKLEGKSKAEDTLKIYDHANTPFVVDKSNMDHIPAILELYRSKKISLRAVFFIREIGGYSNSRLKSVAGKSKAIQFLYSIFYAYFWRKKNNEILNFLESENIEVFAVGYKQMCEDPQKIFTKIAKFCGLSNIDVYGENKGKSHIAFGNRTKKKTIKVKYDSKWKENPLAVFSSKLPFVRLFEEKVLFKYS